MISWNLFQILHYPFSIQNQPYLQANNENVHNHYQMIQRKHLAKFNTYSPEKHSAKQKQSRTSQIDKSVFRKLTTNVILTCERLNAFPIRSEIDLDFCSHLSNSTCTEVLQPVQEGKIRNQKAKNLEEMKMPLFAADIMV